MSQQKKTIYLTRHGQTDYNKLGIVQGSGVNSDLNDLGQKQANGFYEAYKHINFDAVYTSQLKRTVQSVAHFIKDAPKHESLFGLNEINWGIYEGRASTKEEHQHYTEIIEQWRLGNYDIAANNAETPNQLLKRQKKALKHILGFENEKTVLICMHGRAMRSFLCLLLGYELKRMDEFGHSNLCLYKINYENKVFNLELENDISHLNNWINY